MKMLKEQITAKNSRQPMRVSLPEISHVSSTNEAIPDVNELTSWDKGKKKVVEMPRFENSHDRQAYVAPE